MCESGAYQIGGPESLRIMESLDGVTPEAEGLNLVNIFGEQKFVNARIHSPELVEHKIREDQCPPDDV